MGRSKSQDRIADITLTTFIGFDVPFFNFSFMSNLFTKPFHQSVDTSIDDVRTLNVVGQIDESHGIVIVGICNAFNEAVSRLSVCFPYLPFHPVSFYSVFEMAF